LNDYYEKNKERFDQLIDINFTSGNKYVFMKYVEKYLPSEDDHDHDDDSYGSYYDEEDMAEE